MLQKLDGVAETSYHKDTQSFDVMWTALRISRNISCLKINYGKRNNKICYRN